MANAREIELKLWLPPTALRAVERELRALPGPRAVTLQARYFDTPDRLLARRGSALRVRREGRRWVQTFKAARNDFVRTEHEVVRPGPDLEPRVHMPIPEAAWICAPAVADALQLQYETRIVRLARRVTFDGAEVELCLDRGWILSGEAALEVGELELELVAGRPTALAGLAMQWLQRHRALLDPRSKAERGDRLARGLPGTAPKAGRIDVDPERPLADAYRRCVADALEQALRNAAELAAPLGAPAADETSSRSLRIEQVHQLRVGLRRLRVFHQVFDRDDPAPLGEAVGEALREAFQGLGGARDLDVLRDEWLPMMRADGMPAFDLPEAAAANDALAVAGGLRLQEPLLRTLGWLLAGSPEAVPDAPEPPTAREGSSKLLRRLHRRVHRDVEAFDSLDVTARHALRKRCKRLRYVAEGLSGIYPAKPVDRYLRALQHAQASLGALNDLAVARDALRTLAGEQPARWFGEGWIVARESQELGRAREALIAFAAVRPFWA